MRDKQTVQKIKDLRWKELTKNDLEKLMVISYHSAREFAQSLRMACSLYPANKNIQEMAEGELNTTNLFFDDYNKKGDHADYLAHFVAKNQIRVPDNIAKATEKYQTTVQGLSKKVRAMSIFSREQELPTIFEEILQAKDWNTPALNAYRHYLQEHIRLDSSEGGHAQLTSEFNIDDRVNDFYEARLELYHSIPALHP